MGSTCKDTAEDNPQIGGRTELGTHDSTEDRTGARNVQKLNHENLPRRKKNVIHSIVYTQRWSNTIIRSEDLLNKFTVKQIAEYQEYKANTKCYHFTLMLLYNF